VTRRRAGVGARVSSVGPTGFRKGRRCAARRGRRPVTRWHRGTRAAHRLPFL